MGNGERHVNARPSQLDVEEQVNDLLAQIKKKERSKQGSRVTRQCRRKIMALTAMWTHGNAVIPETPELLDKITHLGFGTQVQLRRDTDQWFHVPMPSPVILGGVRPKLQRVIILGRSSISDYIRRVHIFDGSTRVQDHSVLICGDKLEFNPDSVVNANNLPIAKGLGISMLVDGSASASASYFFAAFGADWE